MTYGIDFTSCFFALDMDRTLIDTDSFAKRLPELFGLSEHETAGYRAKELQERGREFDAFGYLSSKYAHVRAPKYDDLVGLFSSVQQCERELLLPGAKELLAALRKSGVPHGIWTKGGEQFQQLKAAVLRTLVDCPELPVSIIADQAGQLKSKASRIEFEWYDEGKEQFLIPGNLHRESAPLWVRSVVVVDDKPANLQHSGSRRIVTILADEKALRDLARAATAV